MLSVTICWIFVEEAQKLHFQFTFDGNRETGTREIADLLHESYIKHSRNPALLPILAEAASAKSFSEDSHRRAETGTVRHRREQVSRAAN